MRGPKPVRGKRPRPMRGKRPAPHQLRSSFPHLFSCAIQGSVSRRREERAFQGRGALVRSTRFPKSREAPFPNQNLRSPDEEKILSARRRPSASFTRGAPRKEKSSVPPGGGALARNPGGHLRAALQAHLRQKRRDVVLHGLLRDTKFLANLTIR